MPETPDWTPTPEASEETSQKLFRTFPCTDSGNGERIAAQFQGEKSDIVFRKRGGFIFRVAVGARPDENVPAGRKSLDVLASKASRIGDDDGLLPGHTRASRLSGLRYIGLCSI